MPSARITRYTNNEIIFTNPSSPNVHNRPDSFGIKESAIDKLSDALQSEDYLNNLLSPRLTVKTVSVNGILFERINEEELNYSSDKKGSTDEGEGHNSKEGNRGNSPDIFEMH